MIAAWAWFGEELGRGLVTLQGAALRGCRAREVRMGGVTRWSWELAGGREGEDGAVGIIRTTGSLVGGLGARHGHTQGRYGTSMCEMARAAARARDK